MRKLFLLLLFIPLFGWGIPADVVWHSQSKNSSESMPVGGGSIGMNVWVENGDIYFYLCRSGSFDENNTLLKQGRFRIRLTPNLDTTHNFSQRLSVYNGYVIISDRNTSVKLWVDVFKPVVHISIDSKKTIVVEYDYHNWRYRNREISKKESFQNSYKFGVPKGVFTSHDTVTPSDCNITFFHQNPDTTVFDATVAQQHLSQYKSEMYNPLKNLIFGGRIFGNNLKYSGTNDGVYDHTDYRSYNLCSRTNSKHHELCIALTDNQGSVADWNHKLDGIVKTINQRNDLESSVKWWNNWWRRSYIEGEGEAEEITRNYTLFRYMMGCNALGDWPTKFNGGLFCFDPSYVKTDFDFTPDYRRWGGGTHTAQNQRLLYWPMLKSGDYDAMKSQLDFYVRILHNAELRSRVYWHHSGAAFTEQLENFGLPEYDEYGTKRPEGFDAGLEYNAWLEYTWDTVLEFCQMALDANSYGGVDISKYVPWIESSLDFFEQHYRYLASRNGRKQLDDNGHIVIYPGSGAETFKMAYNPTSTVCGLKTVTENLIKYLSGIGADSTTLARYKAMSSIWPDISYRDVDGHKVISPAVVWARVNNTEPTMLYPVFPWRKFGVGRDSLSVAVDTWKYDPYVKKFNGYAGWEQTNIWAACLGLTDEAAKWNTLKLKNGPHRFPAFWGPGHDWTPDHNWGGSGMIGIQEMLLQETNDKIIIFPAWPKSWNVRFKLHCSHGTIVEAEMKQGKAHIISVYPKNRIKDITVQ
ncbi:MAG: DUF5703 domain-containing protein [Prevotella sp.]